MRKSIVIVIALMSSASLAANLMVSDIAMGLPIAPFYEGETLSDPGYFHLTSVTTASGILKTTGASGYDYAFSGTVTVSHCDLITDNSSSGVADGDFAGGATLSLVGDLWAVSDTNVLLVDDGVILEGQMQISSSQTWNLNETSPMMIDGSVLFDPSNGGLNTGIVDGSDTLTIGTFRADFSFQNVMPTPSSFADIDFQGMASSLQLVTIPEPCTVLLLTLGGLILRKTR